MNLNEKKTLIKNISWLTISKIIVYTLSIITIALIPRYLGVEAYGELNFVLAFIGFFAVLSDIGLNLLIFRDVSKNKVLAGKYFNNLYLLKMLLILLTSILIIVLTFILPISRNVNVLFYICILYIFFVFFSDFFNSFFNAVSKTKYPAIYEIITKTTYVLLVFLVIYLNKGLIGIFISQIICFGIGFIYLYFCINKYITIKSPKFNFKFIKAKLLISYIFSINYLFTVIYFNIDKILISFFLNNYFVGLYSIGYTLFLIFSGITALVYTVFFPMLSKYSVDIDKLQLIYKKYLKIILLLAIPLTMGGIFLSKQVIRLIFGQDYIVGYIPFCILLLFFFVFAIDQTLSSILYIFKKEKYLLKILFLVAIFNIIFNLIFIPLFGIISAAIITLLSEVIIFIFSYYYITKNIIKINILNESFLIILAGILMVIGLYIIINILHLVILNNKFDVLFYVIIGILMYSMFLLLFKVITIYEIRNYIKLFR